MIESFESAAAQADAAAQAQGLDAEAVAGDAGESAGRVGTREGSSGRGGAQSTAARRESRRARSGRGPCPRVLVYVSCEPASLARDLDHLARLGYRATLAEPFDMMPQTPR